MQPIITGKRWQFYLSQVLLVVGLCIVVGSTFYWAAALLSQLLYGVDDLDTVLRDPFKAKQYPSVQFLINGFVSIGSFIVPALLYPLFLRTKVLKFHHLGRPSSITLIGLTVVLAFLAFNPVQLAAELNALIDVSGWGGFGEWMTETEEFVKSSAEAIIGQKTPLGIGMALLVIAVIPAIGEELLFRGVLQKLFQAWSGKHAGIVITAILFSAIHLEFSGLLPRIFLGLFLGYLFYWTNNLWFPIIVHFLNNAFIVVAWQFYAPGDIDINEIGAPQLWAASAGTLLFAGFMYFFYKVAKLRLKNGKELGEDPYHEPAAPGGIDPRDVV